MTHDPLCYHVAPRYEENRGYWGVCVCSLISRVRKDEGERYDGMAVVHWDAGHAHGLWDAEVTSRKQSLSKGLWIGWAIGTLMLLIPIIVLAVTQ